MDYPSFNLWAEAMIDEIKSSPSLKEAQELLESEFIDIFNKGIALGRRRTLQQMEELAVKKKARGSL